MALPCYTQKECNGCTLCFKEQKAVGRCIICNRKIREGDYSVVTTAGLVCDDTDCLFDFAVQEAQREDLLNYAKEYKEELLSENAEEFFNALKEKKAPVIDLYSFVSQDKSSFALYFLESKRLFLLPSI